MKKYALLLLLLVCGLGYAQSINNYKYIIVPERFDYLASADQFRLNSLTKMMFEKKGFTVFYPNTAIPDELALDRCKALYADVVKDKGFLNTKLTIVLKDCAGTVLFSSVQGTSREKEFQKAYYEALREAAVTVTNLEYKYSGNSTAAPKAVAKSENVYVPAQPAAADVVVNQNQLFAQPIANGYQLVDSTPKVVLKLYKTSQPDSYTGVSETKNGIVFKKGNEWFFEYYQNDKPVTEKLNIKF